MAPPPAAGAGSAGRAGQAGGVDTGADGSHAGAGKTLRDRKRAGRYGARLGTAHYLIGDAIGLLFVLVVRGADAELGLDNGEKPAGCCSPCRACGVGGRP